MEAAKPVAHPPKAKVWELDFSSRPILDARGKKRWELIICDPTRSWTFTRYFPNNKINSTQVRPATCLALHHCSAKQCCCAALATDTHQEEHVMLLSSWTVLLRICCCSV